MGRVFLAGDAAHVHSPAGGQGLNTGLQDAANLSWKLAAALRGHTPDGLLGTYDTERHPVGGEVLRTSGALIRLATLESWLARAVRDRVAASVTAIPAVSHKAARKISGLDVAYARSSIDHRLVGRRAHDVTTADGGRLFEYLGTNKFVLVIRGHVADLAAPWSERLRVVEPVEGSAMLIRPDGHIAWAGEHRDACGALDALRGWLGAGSERGRASAEPPTAEVRETGTSRVVSP